MIFRTMVTIVFVIFLGLGNQAQSQDLEQLARKALVDTAVPESPAFTILNVTSETAVRARTPDELATSLLNNVDQNGNFQT